MTERIEGCLENAPDLIAILDESLHCNYLNKAWRDEIGAENTSLRPATINDLFELEKDDPLPGLLNGLRDHGEAIRDIPITLKGSKSAATNRLCGWCAETRDNRHLLVLSVSAKSRDDSLVEQLTELKTRYQLILNAAGEGIYGIDCDGLGTFANQAATEILGWKEKDIINNPVHDIHHHSLPDGSRYPRENCPIYAAFNDGSVHRVDDEVFWRTDGSAVPVEYTSTPIRQDGKLVGAVVVFRDITKRKLIEREREAAYQEIKQLTEQLEQERDYLRDEVNVNANFAEMIGESQTLRRTLAQIEAVAATSASVLILGESGVGKEMVARAIHAHSPRMDKPLIKVNCGSIPRDLFESEFFGHVKGAFTGAYRDRIGRMQLADGGTLFLDEVGEIPMALQVKLLRALQEQEFERVGDEATISVDVRLIAATNRDLAEEVSAGRFREDLYYRLSVFPIEVPSLRDRSDDIIPLALHFVLKICKELGRDVLHINRQQAKILAAHTWPGNIRELKNVIERAVILSSSDRLRLDLALPASKDIPQQIDKQPLESDDFQPDSHIRQLERKNMVAALRYAGWRVSGPGGAAGLLGLKPSTLAYRMKIFGIDKES